MNLLPKCTLCTQCHKETNGGVPIVAMTKTILGSFFYSLQYLEVKLVHHFNLEKDMNTTIWMRGFVGIIVSLFLICILQIRPWYGKNIKGLLLRGMFGSFSILCSFHSLIYLPLSVATVFFSLTPLWIALYCFLYNIENENLQDTGSTWKPKYTYSCLCCLSGVVVISIPLWFKQEDYWMIQSMGKGYVYALFSSLFQCAVNVSILSLQKNIPWSRLSMP